MIAPHPSQAIAHAHRTARPGAVTTTRVLHCVLSYIAWRIGDADDAGGTEIRS
jgi:hypothetical protein